MTSRSLSLLPATVALLTIASLLAQPTAAQQQPGTWNALTNAPDAVAPPRPLRHDDIFFISPQTGWLVNTAGRIYKTTDGGQSWTLQTDNSQYTFRSVTFTDSLTGFAGLVSSEPDVLFETRDGGSTWNNISNRLDVAAVKGLCGIQAVSENVIVGVGAYWGSPSFVRSNDNGTTWSSIDMSAHAGTLVDVHFFDESNGIVIGGSDQLTNSEAIVLQTSDGGVTWQNVYTSTRASSIGGEWGWKISFPSSDTGYVSVEYLSNPDSHDAKILKTTDGGATWTDLAINGSKDNFGLQGIGFVDNNIGWAGGRGTTSMTSDGGLSWIQLEPYEPLGSGNGQLDPRLNRIFVLSDSVAYSVGRFVHKYVPATPVHVEPLEFVEPQFTIAQNFPNPFDGSTQINYLLESSQPVRIRIFGPTGRLITTLLDSTSQPAGQHAISWDARNVIGEPVASGVYFLVMDIGDIVEMKKMIHVRRSGS